MDANELIHDVDVIKIVVKDMDIVIDNFDDEILSDKSIHFVVEDDDRNDDKVTMKQIAEK